jgi:hypothetical protein
MHETGNETEQARSMVEDKMAVGGGQGSCVQQVAVARATSAVAHGTMAMLYMGLKENLERVEKLIIKLPVLRVTCVLFYDFRTHLTHFYRRIVTY